MRSGPDAPAKGEPHATGGRLRGAVQGAGDRRLAAHDATAAAAVHHKAMPHKEAPNVEDAQPRTLREAALAHGLTVAAEHNIELALLQPTKFEFADTPLSDVIDFLAAQFDINIQLDIKGLADAAVDPSTPITRAIRKSVSLEASLRLILDDLDLAFVIQDEMLKITSKEKADEILTTKVYLVGDLLNRRSDRQVVRPVSGIRINPLVIAIIEAVQPDSWGDNGGPGSISRVGDVFVISQKRDCHVQISALLAQLRADLPPMDDGAVRRSPCAQELCTIAYALETVVGEDAAKAIPQLIAPESWRDNGGPGVVCVVATREDDGDETQERLPRKMLVVRQTDEVQYQVQELLNLFESAHRDLSVRGMCVF